jgi:hypothetical protein
MWSQKASSNEDSGNGRGTSSSKDITTEMTLAWTPKESKDASSRMGTPETACNSINVSKSKSANNTVAGTSQ